MKPYINLIRLLIRSIFLSFPLIFSSLSLYTQTAAAAISVIQRDTVQTISFTDQIAFTDAAIHAVTKLTLSATSAGDSLVLKWAEPHGITNLQTVSNSPYFLVSAPLLITPGPVTDTYQFTIQATFPVTSGSITISQDLGVNIASTGANNTLSTGVSPSGYAYLDEFYDPNASQAVNVPFNVTIKIAGNYATLGNGSASGTNQQISIGPMWAAPAINQVATQTVFKTSINPYLGHTVTPINWHYQIYGGNTQKGNGVVVTPIDPTTGKQPATITFPAVTTAGDTTLSPASSIPAAPANFKLCSPAVQFEISTSAIFTPPATVCIDTTQFAASCPANATLFHWNGVSWDQLPNIANNPPGQICGQTTAFSPFSVFAPLSTSTTSLSATPTVLQAGGLLTLKATVSGASPTGTVQFKANASNLSLPVILVSGIATLTTSELVTPGNYALSAVYSGDSNNTSSSSLILQENVLVANNQQVPTLPVFALLLFGLILFLVSFYLQRKAFN